MNPVVLEVIESEFALLEQIVPRPAAPLLYGRDASCVSDVTERFDEVEEDSVQGIVESSIRRLTTIRGEYPDGGLPEDQEYGWSVIALLSKGLTSAEVRDAAGEIQQEVTKDDRVRAASVTLTQVSLKELRIVIAITPENHNIRPFEFTLVATPDGLREAA